MIKSLTGFVKSFHHAVFGVWFSLKGRNIKIQLIMATLTVVMGLYFSLSWVEWLAITIAIAAVLTVEMLNTAIEEVCNIVKDLSGVPPLATREARDVAAGSSLVISIGALVIGLIVFWPKITALFF